MSLLADALAIWQSNSGAWTLLAFLVYQMYLNSFVPVDLHETKLHAYFRQVEEKQDRNDKRLLATMQVQTAIASVLPQLNKDEIDDYMEANGVDPLKEFVDDDVPDLVTEEDLFE